MSSPAPAPVRHGAPEDSPSMYACRLDREGSTTCPVVSSSLYLHPAQTHPRLENHQVLPASETCPAPQHAMQSASQGYKELGCSRKAWYAPRDNCSTAIHFALTDRRQVLPRHLPCQHGMHWFRELHQLHHSTDQFMQDQVS